MLGRAGKNNRKKFKKGLVVDEIVNYSLFMGRTSDAKERLLDAALELIWERSYGVVTIDAICEKAQVKKGSFYYFFDSKSELAVAALDYNWFSYGKQKWDEIFSPSIPP